MAASWSPVETVVGGDGFPDSGMHPLSESFIAVMSEAVSLHMKKSKDYGREADPFANVRASEDFGVPGWVGCVIRANDKMRRLQAFARKGSLENESVEDSLIDLCVYAAIALVLYRNEQTDLE